MALSVEEAFRRRVILRQLCRNYLQQARHQRIIATDVPPGVQANAMMRFADPLDRNFVRFIEFSIHDGGPMPELGILGRHHVILVFEECECRLVLADVLIELIEDLRQFTHNERFVPGQEITSFSIDLIKFQSRLQILLRVHGSNISV